MTTFAIPFFDLVIISILTDHFGRHPIRRADECLRTTAFDRRQLRGDAEIRQLDLRVRAAEQHVRRW